MVSRFFRFASPLRGSLDAPAAAQLNHSEVEFSGWALAGSKPPNQVELVVNGRDPRPARIGGDRPDVGEALGIPGGGRGCGWVALVDLSGEPPGDVRVQVVAVDRWAKRRMIADRLFMLSGDGMVGYIDAPTYGQEIVGDLLVVTGWSWSAAGVAAVEIDLDGTPLGRARLGLPRPDVRAQNPARFGGATGWEYRGVAPGASRSGRHLVSATVTDLRGVRSRLGSVRVMFTQRSVTVAEQAGAERWQRRTDDALQKVSTTGPDHRNVLVFTHSLSLGGGQLYLQDLLRGLIPQLGYCRLVSPTAGVLAEELEQLGADVVIGGLPMPADVVTYEGAVFQLAMLIKASGCTSVLLNTVGQWAAADAAQRAGVPTIWSIHESYELSDWLNINYGGRPADPYIRGRLDAALINTSRLIFEAEATRELYVRSGVPRRVTRVVPYGVDVDAIDAWAEKFDREEVRRRHGLPADAVVLLCVGVYEERKGQAWLTEAFQKVAAVHTKAVLVLVGSHPSLYSTTVEETILASGLGQRVRTVPITPDIWDWYAVADVLVSCSDVESLPRSMLEAMAFGRSVLACAAWGIPELITEGETGWLVRPKDMAALIAGLHRVLSLDMTERERVGRAARDLVRKAHRAGGYVASYLEMIDELEKGFTPPAATIG